MDEVTQMELNRTYDHHAPTPEVVKQHELFRAQCKALATFMLDNLPPAPESGVAQERLQDVLFWGNAAIARYNAKD